MITFIILIILVLFAWICALHLDRPRQRARAAIMEGRAPLTENQIWEQYYRNSQITRIQFDTAWRSITRQAKLDPEKLRPDDLILTFVNISEAKKVRDEWADVIMKWDNVSKKCGLKVDWTSVKTIDQLLRIIIKCQVNGPKEKSNG